MTVGNPIKAHTIISFPRHKALQYFHYVGSSSSLAFLYMLSVLMHGRPEFQQDLNVLRQRDAALRGELLLCTKIVETDAVYPLSQDILRNRFRQDVSLEQAHPTVEQPTNMREHSRFF